MRWGLRLLPLLGLMLLLGIFVRGLHQDPKLLKTALLGKKIPEFQVPELKSKTFFSATDLRGEVSLLHVWATWCLTCKIEQPILMDIAEQKTVPLYGLAYKDDTDKIKRWLQDYGNPYQKVGLDSQGQVAIDLGVYGTPETYLIDKIGVIRYRKVGPLSHEVWQRDLLPKIKALRSAG